MSLAHTCLSLVRWNCVIVLFSTWVQSVVVHVDLTHLAARMTLGGVLLSFPENHGVLQRCKTSQGNIGIPCSVSATKLKILGKTSHSQLDCFMALGIYHNCYILLVIFILSSSQELTLSGDCSKQNVQFPNHISKFLENIYLAVF